MQCEIEGRWHSGTIGNCCRSSSFVGETFRTWTLWSTVELLGGAHTGRGRLPHPGRLSWRQRRTGSRCHRTQSSPGRQARSDQARSWSRRWSEAGGCGACCLSDWSACASGSRSDERVPPLPGWRRKGWRAAQWPWECRRRKGRSGSRGSSWTNRNKKKIGYQTRSKCWKTEQELISLVSKHVSINFKNHKRSTSASQKEGGNFENMSMHNSSIQTSWQEKSKKLRPLLVRWYDVLLNLQIVSAVVFVANGGSYCDNYGRNTWKSTPKETAANYYNLLARMILKESGQVIQLP